MPDSIKKILGEVIRNLRLEAGMSQEQLAAASGINRAYLGTIERGGKAITVETVERIASGLNIKMSTIFERMESLR